MPAVSKAQQRLFGLVKAVKAGKVKPSDVSKDVRKIAKDMPAKEVEKFAGTKHKGLPEKKKKTDESKINTLRNMIREFVLEVYQESKQSKYINLQENVNKPEVSVGDVIQVVDGAINKKLKAKVTSVPKLSKQWGDVPGRFWTVKIKYVNSGNSHYATWNGKQWEAGEY